MCNEEADPCVAFDLQGAQTIYFSILKPVLLNISSQNRSVAPVTTNSAEHAE